METNRRRPLKVGIALPHSGLMRDPEIPAWPEIRRMAEQAEAIGLDSIWVFDHLLFRFGDGTRGVRECWSLVAALAAATSRVEIGTLVTCVSFRSPALLAKMADTVDEISDGRLVLGLGAGWHEPEYTAFGYPFDHRVSRFEEALQIICPLLRDGKVDFAGKYHQARECELLPRGPRPGGPPILVAASGERMLELTARHADLWNGCWYRSPADVAGPRARVDAACVAAGRDPASLGRTAGIYADFGGRAGRLRGAPGPLYDSPDAVADALRGYAAEGISHVQVWLDPMDLAGLEALAPALELLDRG